jgi:hypothetical protein
MCARRGRIQRDRPSWGLHISHFDEKIQTNTEHSPTRRESRPDRDERNQKSQMMITIPPVLVNGKGSVRLYSFEGLVQLQGAKTLWENTLEGASWLAGRYPGFSES